MSFYKIYNTIKNDALTTYILDSNVVLDLIKFHKGMILDPNKLSETKQLIAFLKKKDVATGLAIAELCWDYQACTTDENKKNEYEQILCNLLYNENNIINDISNNNGKKNFSSLVNNAKVNHLLLPSLCLMKKFSIILNSKNSKQKKFKNLITFINEDLKFLPSYELSLIIYYLFSNKTTKKNFLLKFFKLSSNKIEDKNIYNGCWDICFLRLINELSSRAKGNTPIYDIYNACLITSDKALIEFSNEIYEENKITYTLDFNPCIELLPEDFSHDDYSLIENQLNILSQSRKERLEYINNHGFNHFKIILNKLLNEN